MTSPRTTETEATPETPPVADDDRRLIRWAAWLSIAALLAHAVDVPDHLREWWGYSTFFVVVGAFQFFYAFLLVFRPWRYDETGGLRNDPRRFGRPYYVLGIGLAVSLLIVYIDSRTVGLPFLGPEAGRQPLTFLGLVPVVQDLALLLVLVKLWRGAR